MNRRKKIFKIFIFILVLWLGVTFYFITQHSVIGKEAKFNEIIEFEDVTIQLDSLVLYNFERKSFFDLRNMENDLRYKILAKLPMTLVEPYMRVRYLYSAPYQIDNEFYRTALYGKCIFERDEIESEKYLQYLADNLKIKVWDSADYGYSSSYSSHYMSDSNEVDFKVEGSNGFPIERLDGGFRIVVKHLESGDEREFIVDAQDFVTYKHNDWFGKAFPFRNKLY